MRTNGLRFFGSNNDALIEQCAAVMADTVTGAQDSQISNFFSGPLFGEREDLAYFQGCRAIKSLRLGPFGMGQLNRQSEQALANHGLSGIGIDLQVAQFQVYYWTMTICLTHGTERQLARKKATKSRSVVSRLRSQIGEHATFSS